MCLSSPPAMDRGRIEPGRYRIKAPAMAIFSSNGERFHVTVPQGVIVSVQRDRTNDRLINVVWNGTPYLMFEQDLRDRGELLD
jgi:hypothetical protein